MLIFFFKWKNNYLIDYYNINNIYTIYWYDYQDSWIFLTQIIENINDYFLQFILIIFYFCLKILVNYFFF